VLKQRLSSLILPVGISAASLLLAHLYAAIPFDSARISYVENHVSIGSLRGSSRHAAALKDTVRSSDYVQTEVESRAELEFEDTSLVRIGQNTIFTFESASRTMNLKKGAMLFYVPPGSGGAQIKTPSITAAITGTVGKAGADNARELIAILSGSLHTKWGDVPAGWAIEWVNGQVRIFKFDPSEVTTGKLYSLGGRHMPEEPEVLVTRNLEHLKDGVDLHGFDVREITLVNPRVDKGLRKEDVETPTPTPMPSSSPSFTPNPYGP
jgi:hypothetical protein